MKTGMHFAADVSSTHFKPELDHAIKIYLGLRMASTHDILKQTLGFHFGCEAF